jgi:hypothetical protein
MTAQPSRLAADEQCCSISYQQQPSLDLIHLRHSRLGRHGSRRRLVQPYHAPHTATFGWWTLLLSLAAAATMNTYAFGFITVTTSTTLHQQRRGSAAVSSLHVRLDAVSPSAMSTSSSSSPSQSLEPPAITIEHLSCTHDGGENWQLQDVSYILPRGASTYEKMNHSMLDLSSCCSEQTCQIN